MNMTLMLVLVILASARTFRLLTTDAITDGLRDRLDIWLGKYSSHAVQWVPPRRKYMSDKEWRRYRQVKWLQELGSCKYCLGYWIAVAWTATGLAWSDTWAWKLLAISFAANYVMAVTYDRLSDPEVDDE